jgi:hypothetical protein
MFGCEKPRRNMRLTGCSRVGPPRCRSLSHVLRHSSGCPFRAAKEEEEGRKEQEEEQGQA